MLDYVTLPLYHLSGLEFEGQWKDRDGGDGRKRDIQGFPGITNLRKDEETVAKGESLAGQSEQGEAGPGLDTTAVLTGESLGECKKRY